MIAWVEDSPPTPDYGPIGGLQIPRGRAFGMPYFRGRKFVRGPKGPSLIETNDSSLRGNHCRTGPIVDAELR